MSSLDHPAAQDVAAALAACQARVLEREGIPMFVALHDARPGRQLHVVEPAPRAEGRRLAALLDHYGAGTAEQDVGGLVDAVVVLSEQHLRADVTR